MNTDVSKVFSFYLLLFADLLPGLKAVGLPISLHDPELPLQFGQF